MPVKLHPEESALEVVQEMWFALNDTQLMARSLTVVGEQEVVVPLGVIVLAELLDDTSSILVGETALWETEVWIVESRELLSDDRDVR
jgi:hypothetical protein